MSSATLIPESSKVPPVVETCFHCGLPVPAGLEESVVVLGESRPMCCAGCAAVAHAIVDAGQESFYRFRTDKGPNPENLVPNFLQNARVFDQPELQKRFTRELQENLRETSLIIEGIVCAACVWLNEQYLSSLSGVIEVDINYATHRARIKWDPAQIRLSGIIDAITHIGYLAHPYEPGRQFELLERQRRNLLKKLGVAGVLAAQVMMFSVAMYAGDWWGMEPQYRRYFSWISLFLTLPVLLYSAQPFFIAAWRDLRRKTAGMDVPVALGISIAFIASVVHTLTGQGHLYFDSVVMFVFFLLGVRFLELGARKKAVAASERLVNAVPGVATRLDERDNEETVAANQLRTGDQVLVRPGETVAADGIIVRGETSVSEAVLTGEELPIMKSVDSPVTAGSLNLEAPFVLQVTQTGTSTFLAEIQRLVDRAQSEKPRIARLADQVAAKFVYGILAIAAAVAVYWYIHDPSRWIEVTITVLVVTCPCALSLATPAALAAATGALLQTGLLATRAGALEILAKARCFVFDKTGTLTNGRPVITQTTPLADIDGPHCLAVAAALARSSEHPVATAFRSTDEPFRADIDTFETVTGRGICASVDGTRYCLGNASMLQKQSGLAPPDYVARHPGATLSYLATGQKVICIFELSDAPRKSAKSLVDWLNQCGNQTLILSGDRNEAVAGTASALNVQSFEARLLPDDKRTRVQNLQQSGKVVCMIGDGVNDAPVLSQADVSIALATGTDIAANSADMLLFSDDLSALKSGIMIARKTLRIIRENLAWAIIYNLVALPAAAAGLLAPWMAALGMSASSLVVVANALRLTRAPEPHSSDR